MDPFGDGETGKTSMDSSKKDGRGTGGRVIRLSALLLASFIGAMVGSMGILPLMGPWSVGWILVGGASSPAAVRGSGCVMFLVTGSLTSSPFFVFSYFGCGCGRATGCGHSGGGGGLGGEFFVGRGGVHCKLGQGNGGGFKYANRAVKGVS